MKKHFSPALAVLGVTFLMGAVQVQAADKMKPGMMNTMTTSDADKQFMTELAQGSVYDQDTAQLAVQKAHSKSVQRYALKLMDDHNRLNKQLFIQANKRGVTLPITISDDDKTKLQNYMDMPAGSDFDTAYLQEAIRINADDVKKGQSAITASSDREFRSLINDYVGTEQKHLNEASALLAAMQRSMGTMNNGMMNGTTMTPGTMNNGTMAPTGTMNNGTMAPTTGTINADNGTMNSPATQGTMPPATTQ